MRKGLWWVLLSGAALAPVVYVFFSSPEYHFWQADFWGALKPAPVVLGRQYYSRLDGTIVKNKAEEARQVVGVMIDNHPDARPEAGLDEARIVYEVPVEGLITRYLAIFDSAESVSKVGPVRSARPYFLDWVKEYGGALYMHSGGSAEALADIKTLNIFDANEFFWGEYYWRGSNRVAPHNLYTKSDSWQMAIDKINSGKLAAPAPIGWKFAENFSSAEANGAPNKEISIHYSSIYSVSWKYDPSQTGYVRYINGERYVDQSGDEVRAKNVLVQYVNMKTIDEDGRQEITTIGRGEAKILKKGILALGSWEKKSLTDRTMFFAVGGKENIFLPGKTWIEVVPVDAKLEIAN